MSEQKSWIRIPVDDDVLDSARAIRAERDKIYGNIYEEKSTDMRHVGEIGEFGVDYFLRGYGTGLHEWLVNGKVSGKPDFIFAGKKIGVKTVKRAGLLREDYGAQITDKHKNEDVDYFLFCCYLVKSQEIVILGGLTKQEFLDQATYFKADDKVHKDYMIRKKHGIYNITIKQLTEPKQLVHQILRQYTIERRLSRSSVSSNAVPSVERLAETYGLA